MYKFWLVMANVVGALVLVLLFYWFIRLVF